MPNAIDATAIFQAGFPNAINTINVSVGVTVGTIQFDNAFNSFITGSDITFDVSAGQGQILFNSGGWTISNNLVLSDGLTVNGSSNGILNGIISGAQAFTKLGTGTVTLGGVNTYSGATTITGGTLQLGAAGRIADSSALSIGVGAVFDLNNFNETIGSLAGAGNTMLGSATLTAGGDNSSTTFSGVMSGTGGFTKLGTGTLIFGGVNTYSGATTITGGTLQLSAAGRIAYGSALSISVGAVFDLNNFNETIGSLAGAGNTTLGSATLTAGGDNSSTTFSGVMSGTGGFTKLGTGTLIFGGVNTYTGATTITGGTLQLSAAGRIADGSALSIGVGAVFDLNNFNETIGSLAGAGNTMLGSATLTAGGDNSSTTFSGVMSGTGGFTKLGTGTLIFGGVNTYSGATTITGGTLQLGAAGRIADGSALSIGAGAVFDLNNFNETVGSLAGAGNTTLGSATLTAGGDNSSTTFSGVMSGTGGFTKLGTGTLIFSGVNTYSGATTITGGTLQLSAADRIANGSALSVGAGAVFDLNNFNETVGSLAGAGNTMLGSATLTAGGDNSSTTFSGVMSGTGGFTKLGTGTLTFSGTSTYNGATNVNAGRLDVNGTVASAVAVNNGGTLGGTGTVGAVTVNNGGTFAPGNSIGATAVSTTYTQNAGSTFQVEVNASGTTPGVNNDVVNVTGATTLNGGTVDVQGAPGNYTAGMTYTILNSTGGVTGTFADIINNIALLDAFLIHNANSVQVQLQRIAGNFAAVSATRNQRAVGIVLDGANAMAGGDLGTAFDQLVQLTPSQQRIAMEQLTVELHGSTIATGFQTTTSFINVISRRIRPFDRNNGRRFGLNGGNFGGSFAAAMVGTAQGLNGNILLTSYDSAVNDLDYNANSHRSGNGGCAGGYGCSSGYCNCSKTNAWVQGFGQGGDISGDAKGVTGLPS